MARAMRKIWVHKSTSFTEAKDFDRHYYERMTPSERLQVVQFLRESFLKMGMKGVHGRRRKGLRGSIKVIQPLREDDFSRPGLIY